jgi:hypothetical protein
LWRRLRHHLGRTIVPSIVAITTHSSLNDKPQSELVVPRADAVARMVSP